MFRKIQKISIGRSLGFLPLAGGGGVWYGGGGCLNGGYGLSAVQRGKNRNNKCWFAYNGNV